MLKFRILFGAVVVFSYTFFAIAQDQTDDRLFERYVQESKKLEEEFLPVFNRLQDEDRVSSGVGNPRDTEKWYREYDQPLFAAVKSAMANVAGTDDYLEMWEKRIPEKIISRSSAQRAESIGTGNQNINANFPFRSLLRSFGDSPLLMLYTLTVVQDEVKEYVPEISPPLGGLSGNAALPPMYPTIALSSTTFDPSWHVMAIYSFKNDRARDVLFELAMQSDQRRDPLADGAAYYLSLFPNSGELLPEIEGRLKEEIATARRELPDLSKAMFQENGDVVDQTEFREHVRRYDSFQKIGRLLALKNSLEYNEKIPADERERFDAFRREVAMSWSASNKRQRALPHWGALLKKGDEHFEIYLMEYPLPGLGVPVFRLENDGDSYPYTLTNPYWQKRKAFYERELADPRPLYTEAQIQYMERKLADIRAMER